MNTFQLNSTLPHHQPTHRGQFSFMGEELVIESNHPVILEVSVEAFGKCIERSDFAEIPLKISLFVDASAAPDADGDPHAHDRLVAHTQDHLLYLSVGGRNTAVADLASGQAFGVLTPAMTRDPEFIRYTFLEALAQAMLGLSRNFVAVHAAGVVRDGITVLLPAPAGTGKSTLAYACARRGYQVLAEDVIQVDLKTTPLQLWGLPRKFHLLQDARQFFPELQEEKAVRQVNGEWKLVVDVERYHPGATVNSAKPGVIVFLHRDGTSRAADLVPMRTDEALRRLEVIWSWTTGWQDWMSRRIPELMPLGAFELLAGADPHESVDRLDQLLQAVQQLPNE